MSFGQKTHDRALVDAIYAQRGIKTSSEVGAEYGITRNAVIGIWARERARRGDHVIRHSKGRGRVVSDDDRRLAVNRRRAASRRLAAQMREAAAKSKPEKDIWRHFIPADTSAEPANKGRGVTFFELEPSSCRFPLGGPTEPATAFCGAVSIKGCPYCSAHMLIAYYPARMMTPAAPTFREAAE